MLLIVATFAFLFASVKLADAIAITWSGVRTTGTITGHERPRKSWYAIYTFEDANGRRFEGRTRATAGGTGPNARERREAEVGRSVAVIYDPTDPSRSVTDTFWGRWNYLVMMLFVLPHMLIGAYAIRHDRREQIEEGWVQPRF